MLLLLDGECVEADHEDADAMVAIFSKVGPGAIFWLTMLSDSIVLLNLQKEGTCVFRSLKKV